jgi:hypothetical protein
MAAVYGALAQAQLHSHPGRSRAAGLPAAKDGPKLGASEEGNMYEHGMIAPVVALAIWSFIMLIWLYATRIPAMRAAKIDPEAFKDDPGAARAKMPVGPARVAANYTHLMEQPTIFYAVCFALQFLALEAGQPVHPINIGLAWAYVGLRVVHSLVQATVNIIMLRFFIFAVSSLALGALLVHAAMGVGMVNISPH